MLQRIKRMKRWKKIMLGSTGSLLVIFAAVAGYLYYQLNQIDLADIERRIEQRGQDQQEEETQEVPGILKGSIDTASSIAGKPIDGQDALDAAAILMKSGLGIKEIYFLLGKSTDKLSNDEKQKIRDILLAKLNEDEIKALRTITTEYGKTLVILDKNYPIELVGVYDEAERAKIQKELNEKRKGSVEQPQPNVSSTLNSPAPSPVTSMMPESSQTPSVPTEDSGAKAQKLRDAYQSKLNTLKQGCTNQVNSIVSEIATDINASQSEGKSLSLSILQSKYLTKVESAESSCDSQFQKLVADARSEYALKELPLNDIAIWNNDYEKAKQEARAQAMSILMSSLSQ